MNDPVIIDAGTLTFSDEDLSATGLLVPYGVKCRSNLGEFEVGSGVFSIPEDTTGMVLNIEHKREHVAGGIAKAWEQPDGIMGTFKFANTKTGRQAYADAKSGKRKNLSAEVAGVLIRGGKAIAGAVFGGAVVEKPAFEGATLLAAEDSPAEAVPSEFEAPERASSSTYVSEFTDETGARWRRVEENVSTTTVTKITDDEEEEDPAEEIPAETQGETMNAAAPSTVPAAPAVPGTLLAGASGQTLTSAGGASAEQIGKAYDLGTIFAAMHTVKAGGVANVEEAETLLAALADIKVNAAGGLTTAEGGVIQPAWVGKVWQGRTYARKFIDLVVHNYGINISGRKGFKLDQGTALVQRWNGNKAEIPTGTASTSVVSATRRAYGFAADIAREFWDLEGGEEVIAAFIQGVVDSYAKITDIDALRDLLGVATGSVTAGGVITPDGSRIQPAGTYPTEYPEAMGLVIDAIDAVTDADDDPAFVLVNKAAWRELRFTPKDKVPEYIKFAVRGDGTADADKVIVKRAPDAEFATVGFDNTEPAVVAGSHNGVEMREQGQTPIKLDALDLARGGVDKAVIGYLETFVVRPEAYQAFGTKTV